MKWLSDCCERSISALCECRRERIEVGHRKQDGLHGWNLLTVNVNIICYIKGFYSPSTPSRICLCLSFVLKVISFLFYVLIFGLNPAEKWREHYYPINTVWHEENILQMMSTGMKCVRVTMPVCSSVWLWICLVVYYGVYTHTRTQTHICMFMGPDSCVGLAHSLSGLCPLGRPCVAQFCSNRFWQLCNFCWFIPDLGELFFCSAGVICKAHTHIHVYIPYIYNLRTRAKQANYLIYTATQFCSHTSHIHPYIHQSAHPSAHIHTSAYISPHHPPSTHIHTHTCTHSVLIGHQPMTTFPISLSSNVDWLNGSLVRWATSSVLL